MREVIVYALLLLVSVGIISCQDDDAQTVTSTPEFETLNANIQALPGVDFTFEAVVTDPAGIKSVNMRYLPWFLDKTIVKDSLPTQYRLRYRFKVPEKAEEGSIHNIPITVTNAGGKETTQEVTVTLNKDVLPPTIVVESPADGATALIGMGPEFTLSMTFEDNEALALLKVESTLLNEEIALEGTSGDFNRSFDIENTGNYIFKVTVSDVSGNTSQQTFGVNVRDELAFDQMYITNESDDTGLASSLFGIPQPMEASTLPEEQGFVFKAQYYAASAQEAVRFIPQKSSFAPFAFGTHPDIEGQLAIGESQAVAPLVLPEAGYYDIVVDLQNLTVSATPYTPSDTPFAQVYVIGRGVRVGEVTTCMDADGATLCWNFGSGKPFQPVPGNPYRWTLALTLEDQPNDEGENGFILNANPAGWSPFWRFDDRTAPMATVPNGGTEFVYGTESFGEYLFTFDTHLNRLIAKRL